MNAKLAKLFKTTPEIFAWSLYDWANSTCSTTIMAGFFPAFLKDFWSPGVDVTLTTARLGFANSVTSIIVAALAPTLGALADHRGHKKLYCFLFMLVGVLSSISLAFIPKGEWFAALMAFSVVMIGFNASLIFYDSLITSVASPAQSDYASSLGYSLGYLGGGILFLLNVVMVVKPELFGLADSIQAVQAAFISVGIWWLLFSIPMFKIVKERKVPRSEYKSWGGFFSGSRQTFQKIWGTFLQLKKDQNSLRFLFSFWLYIDGVYTVMTMAVDFGKSIHLETRDLMLALLLVQFLGFPFSILFSKLAQKYGCKLPILISIFFYGVTVLLAGSIEKTWHFFALSCLIGMVQGGVQALSRSMFAKMIPVEFSGEYFGLFNLVGKFAAILGPLIVGIGAYLTGNPATGISGLIVLFIIGGYLLLGVREPTT